MATAHPRNLTRLSEILHVAVRHGFGYLFDGRRLRELVPWPGRAEADQVEGTRGQRLRAMLDELGPTFVKFGQLLSTRPDLLPPDVIAELRHLQDQAAPIPFSEVERVLRDELGAPPDELFAELDPHPIAAASIGQVHAATLRTGERVAVKVQRPTAPDRIEADIALLYQVARLAKDHVRRLDFVDAVEVVDEFARAIRSELDYRAEAANAERFRAAFEGNPRVVIPRVFPELSRGRVLTLEFVDGELLRDAGERSSPEERRRLAYAVAEVWLEMIFRHGHFHGDPHPANILVLPDGSLGLVDFGISGRLSPEDVHRLVLLFLDAVAGRTDALPRRLADLGVRYPPRQEEELRAELETLWFRYQGPSAGEVDPNDLLRDALRMVNRLGLRLPSRFILLDRALITLGAVGAELYPAFNVFELARPYARELAMELYSPAALLTRARGELAASTQAALDLPRDAGALAEQLLRGELELGVRATGLDEPIRRLDATANRLVLALVVAGLLIGSAQIAGVPGGPHVLGIHVAALLGFLAACALGTVLAVAMVRRGRL